MDTNHRPLSPHLQVYKLPLTAVLSISHRFTGVLLCLGMFAFTASLLIAATSAQNYETLQAFLAYIPIKLFLVAFVYMLFFHWCHGIRHLIMDFGKTLDRQDMTRYALVEVVLSALLTAGAVIFFWAE